MHSNLGTPVRSYVDKSGTSNAQGIRVDRLIRATPPIYQCSCNQCGTSFPCSHTRVDSISCPNALAHGREDRSRSQITQTISPNTATRSRDAASAREYQRQETPQSVRYSFTGEPSFTGADSSSIAAYLDYQQEKNS